MTKDELDKINNLLILLRQTKVKGTEENFINGFYPDLSTSQLIFDCVLGLIDYRVKVDRNIKIDMSLI